MRDSFNKFACDRLVRFPGLKDRIMTADARPEGPGIPVGMLFACLVMIGTGPGQAAQEPETNVRLADLQADCRVEGEAGGLNGGELEQFVAECVNDLQTVEFSNSAE